MKETFERVTERRGKVEVPIKHLYRGSIRPPAATGRRSIMRGLRIGRGSSGRFHSGPI
jgi:hypothetical protein